MARTKFSIAIMLGLMAGAGCASDPSAEDGSGSSGGGPGGVASDDQNADGIPDDQTPDEPDVQPTYPTAHPRIYLTPNRERLEKALAEGTPAATVFKATVDRWVAGASLWGFEAWNAALLSQLTGDPAYCTAAIKPIEAQVVDAEAKIAAQQAPQVAHDSYLAVGELIGDLALVYDWCFDQVTPAQRARWIAYANQAVWNVWNHTQATWGGKVIPWSGWSTTNPSNNYWSSFMRATMLLGLATKGENPQADAWIAQFRDKKMYGELVPTFDRDLVGGGSREGTGYGVAMRRIYEMYAWWRATTGENLATKTQHTRSSLVAFIHQVMPTLDRVAPTGDHTRDHSAALYDYHRDYVQQLVMLFPNDAMARRAKGLLADSSVPGMTQAYMHVHEFLNDRPDVAAAPLTDLNTAYYAPGIGQVYARSGWDKGATWVNLIAGPYTESHAHQDQGSIMLYKGGWLAYDPNIESRSGLAQETTAHSLVRIDSGGAPVRQIATTTSKLQALAQGDGYVYASADLTPAYRNNAAVQKVHRELVYLLPDVVIVYDRVQSAAGTTQTWQLATPVAPAIAGATATVTSAGHTLAVTRVAPAAAAMSSYSYASSGQFTGGYRLDERMPGGDQRYLHVLGVDGAARAITPAGADGVTVSLADGRQATVTFDRDAAGATLTLDGATTELGEGVAQLPL